MIRWRWGNVFQKSPKRTGRHLWTTPSCKQRTIVQIFLLNRYGWMSCSISETCLSRYSLDFVTMKFFKVFTIIGVLLAAGTSHNSNFETCAIEQEIFIVEIDFFFSTAWTTALSVHSPSPFCKKNESFQTCSNGCEYNCANYAIAGICAPDCDPDRAGCYCYFTHVRNSNGDCVSYEACKKGKSVFLKTIRQFLKAVRWSLEPKAAPQKEKLEPQRHCSSKYETFTPCGRLCPLTCATKDRVYKCKEGCQPGCFCNEGYLRNSQKECVPRSLCEESSE